MFVGNDEGYSKISHMIRTFSRSRSNMAASSTDLPAKRLSASE